MDRRVSGLEKQLKSLKADNNNLATRLARVEGNFPRKFSNEMRKLATDYLIQNPDLPEEDPIVMIDGKRETNLDGSPSAELAKYGVAIKEQRKLKKKSYYYDFDFNNDSASPGDLPTEDVQTKTAAGQDAPGKKPKKKTAACAKCSIM